MTARSLELWRQPEFTAAVLNGGLVLLLPAIWAGYLDYTWTAVRPSPPTLLSSAVSALPVLVILAPVSLAVACRTFVHARAFRVKPTTVWRGPVESAAVGGGIALLIMIPATALTWGREPFHLVVLYIAIYVAVTALAGLVLGLVLAAAALLAIRLRT